MGDIACQSKPTVCGAPSEYRFAARRWMTSPMRTIYLCGEHHLELVNLGRIIESWVVGLEIRA